MHTLYKRYDLSVKMRLLEAHEGNWIGLDVLVKGAWCQYATMVDLHSQRMGF